MWRYAIILFFLPVLGFTQKVNTDSVIHLSEIEVTSSRLNRLSTGLNITRFDSLTLEINKGKSLSSLISDETPVYIKSYGPGNLSTISMRGTSSTQTGLYWNGIRLNPPNIDMEDLSLYPSSFFNDIKILKGGGGSLFGNGNIGGSIHLQNNPVFKKNIDVSVGGTAGSFNDYRAFAGAVVSNRKVWSNSQFIYKNAKNNFTYKNPDGEQVERINAAQKQYGFMQDLYFIAGERNILGASLWYQSADRKIPGSVQVPQSDAYQQDNSFRSLISYKRFRNKGNFLTKAAYIHSYLHYFDPSSVQEAEIDNTIVTNAAVIELNAEQSVNDRLFLSAGVKYRYEYCSTVAYKDTPDRNTTGLFASVNYRIPFIEWNVTTNLRQDFIDGYGAPFQPAFGLEGKILKFIYGKVNISRNFRVPTFNDLYWYPYGNLSLKPEKSWNEEASLIFKNKIEPDYELTITGFNSVIDDYIIWIPVTGNLWSPENIQTVWARGMEVNGTVKVKAGDAAIRLKAGYSYTKSTNLKQTGPNDNSEGKQLIYVPVNGFNGNITFTFKGFVLKYGHSYTGLRYTTRDNTEYLPGYSLGDALLGKDIELKEFGIKVQLEILNLYNTEYQSVAYYPMPGRNYRLSLFFKI
jgi:iron complex outermembrane receptor protein